MPPKAAGRRRTPRLASREPDSTPSAQSGFQKPNLPPLQGTPSSRRQYAYGAAAEPVPSRPGRGLQRGQVLDLGTAVRSALVRHDEEEERGAARALGQSADPDEDELAGSTDTASRGPSHIVREVFNLGGQGADMSENDDARSFGMESDYYVDATINSTPGSMPPPSTHGTARGTAAKADAASASPKTRASTRSQGQPRQLQDLVEDNSSDLDTESRPAITTTRARKPLASDVAGKTQVGVRKPPGQRGGGAGEKQAEVTETEDTRATKPSRLQQNTSANAFASRREQIGARGKSQTRVARADTNRPSEAEGRTHPESAPAVSEKSAPTRRRGRPAAGDQPAGDKSTRRKRWGGEDSGEESGSESGRWITGATRASATNALFANAPLLQPSLTGHHATTRGELGAGDLRRFERHHEMEDEHDASRNWGAWLDFLVPRRLRRGAQVDETDGIEQEEAPAINWWQLLNPWTYVKAMAWVAVAVWEWLVGVLASLLPARTPIFIQRAWRQLPYAISAIISLLLALALMRAAYTHSRDSTADDLWDPVSRGSVWGSLNGITSKLGGYMPRISWPSSSWAGDLDWEMDGDTRATCDDYLQKTKLAFQSLEKTGRLHDGALRRLEAVLPKVVHMQLKNGKPVVATEFYHALRDLIREDDTVLTFAEEGGDYGVTSERQWKTLATRLMKDPAFTSTLNLTVDEAENRLSERVTGFWNTWVKQNEAKIQQAIGSAVDQINSAGSQREFDERLGAILREQLRDSGQRGLIVTRDEFLRHLGNEVAALRGEIRAELGELQPRLEKLVRDSVDLATRDMPPSVSRAEVTSLVNGLVRRAFADVNLEAVAQGKIHAHWDAELKHQVNYFSVGAGATIDARHSSATYDALKPRFFAHGAFRSGARRPLPPAAALAPWADVGDCWCAARAVNHRGNPHGAALSVQLAHRVVPQHLVLEHILPGATTDPGARPRDVEVYAVIPDEAVRARVRDFAAVTYPAPDPAEDWNHTPADLPPQFVLISRFVYEGAELHDGVHVHRLSSELVALGADTDQVVVRATSNYGAPSHTCFYRVRLYGRNVETEGPGGNAEGADWE